MTNQLNAARRVRGPGALLFLRRMLHLGALRRVALALRPLLWRAAALRNGHDLVVAQLVARLGRRLVDADLGDYGNIITVLVVDEDEADALLRG